MATVKKIRAVSPPPPKKSISEVRAENEKLREEIDKLKNGGWCYMCGEHKSFSHFYVGTDTKVKSGYSPICKECAKALAERQDANGNYHEPTKDSVKLALKYLNKPFLESVWNASMEESNNLTLGKTKTNVWTSYIKNISMRNYVGMTWEDSDMFKQVILYDDEKTEQQIVEEHSGQDTYDAFLKNKEDVTRLLDYDPFEAEPVKDQPFLYSQLLGMLDASEDANEDMMRVSAAIQIVRAFLQLSKLDDAIAKLMGDIKMISDNASAIRSIQDSKQKLTAQIKTLAEENCLSLKHSKSKTKGEDTFTGRLRKLKELNLRNADLNGFDVATCKGMQQVADASMEAIIKGLHFSEDEMSDIVAMQRRRIAKMDLETKSYKEAVRILLRENLSLRDTLEEKGELNGNLIDLDDFVGTYLVPKKEGIPDG
jgi:hypothetical protein